MKERSFLGHVLGSFFGFLLFVVIWVLLNVVSAIFDLWLLDQIVRFLNVNIHLFFIISILGFIARIFDFVKFPFNLCGPLVYAFNSIFTYALFLRGVDFVGYVANSGLLHRFANSFFAIMLYPVIFMIVLVTGYSVLLIREIFPQKKRIQHKQRISSKCDSVDWENVRFKVGDFMEKFGERIKNL